MKRVLQFTLVALVLALMSQAVPAQSAGTFRGVLVGHGSAEPNWIYVQSVNGALRRVEISKAEVVWGETVPSSARAAAAKTALKEGAEVRVTAKPGQDGDWQADRVEILNLHATPVQDLPRLSDRLPSDIA